MVLHVDVCLGLAGQEGTVQVKSLQPHLFVDNLSKPVIMQGHILHSGFRFDRKNGEVSTVTKLNLS